MSEGVSDDQEGKGGKKGQRRTIFKVARGGNARLRRSITLIKVNARPTRLIILKHKLVVNFARNG